MRIRSCRAAVRVTDESRSHWTTRSGKATRPVEPESEDLLAHVVQRASRLSSRRQWVPLHNLDAVERRPDVRRLPWWLMVAVLVPAALLTAVVSTGFGAEPLPLHVVVTHADHPRALVHPGPDQGLEIATPVLPTSPSDRGWSES